MTTMPPEHHSKIRQGHVIDMAGIQLLDIKVGSSGHEKTLYAAYFEVSGYH